MAPRGWRRRPCRRPAEAAPSSSPSRRSSGRAEPRKHGPSHDRGALMPFEVKLPDIGEGVAEGEIVRWLVKAGESVKEDQPLVEVMTDKASVEIPSPRSGTIEAILVEEGAVVPVGTVLVRIAVQGGAGAGSAAAPAG